MRVNAFYHDRLRLVWAWRRPEWFRVQQCFWALCLGFVTISYVYEAVKPWGNEKP